MTAILICTHNDNPIKATEDMIYFNKCFYSIRKIICNGMASTVETEVGVLFTSTKKGNEIKFALEEMGHNNLKLEDIQ
eukprot:7504781-Ditylum_brightwellii.AAC.1